MHQDHEIQRLLQIRGSQIPPRRTAHVLKTTLPTPSTPPRIRNRVMNCGAHVVYGRVDINGQGHRVLAPKDKSTRV
eukprot:10021391-Prorocentrum_lima.AAC.1